jgi:hypothetical protein
MRIMTLSKREDWRGNECSQSNIQPLPGGKQKKKKDKKDTQDAEIRPDYLKSEVIPHDLTNCSMSLLCFYNKFQCLSRAGI